MQIGKTRIGEHTHAHTSHGERVQRVLRVDEYHPHRARVFSVFHFVEPVYSATTNQRDFSFDLGSIL